MKFRSVEASTARVVVLVDASAPVLRLVTGLASQGLAIRHDPVEGALLIIPTQVQEEQRT